MRVQNLEIQWTDLDGERADIKSTLQSEHNLSVEVQSLLLDVKNPSMYKKVDEGLYISLFGQVTDIDEGLANMRGLRFYITDANIISVHWGMAEIVELAKKKSRSLQAGYGTYGLLSVLAIAIAEQLVEYLETIIQKGTCLELKSNEYGVSSTELDELRSNIFRLHSKLAPLETVIRFVASDPFQQIPDADKRHLLTAANFVGLYLEKLSASETRSELLHDRLMVRTNEKIVRSSYRLTVAATVFLPLTFITGLLGMNVAGIPEDHDPLGFWVVCLVLILIGGFCWHGLHKCDPFNG